VLALLVLGAIAERRGRWGMLACVGASAAAISVGCLMLLPDVMIYRGLSGIDSALFAFAAVALFIEARRGDAALPAWSIGLAMLAFLGKSVFELTTGRALFVDSASAFEPVPLAHLIGAAVGVATGACFSSTSLRRPVSERPWRWLTRQSGAVAGIR
jgi:hypothetical protein